MGNKTPRFLVIAPSNPFPPRDAVAIRVLEFIRLLDGEVDLLVFGDDDRDEPLAGGHGGRLIRVKRPPRKSLSPLQQSLFGDPTTLAQFRSESFATRVRERLALSPCLVLAIGLQMAQYLDAVPREVPRILDDYNVEWLILHRLAGLKSGPRRLYWQREASKLRGWEGRLLCKADVVTAISEIDRAGLLELAPGHDVRVVGPCIPETPISETSSARATSVRATSARASSVRATLPTLVFTGAFGWHVNVQAAEWFCREVAPLLRARLGDFRTQLVGKDPSPEVVALQELPGVEVTGAVPEVRPYLERGTVAIVPLQYGSGVRYKILEAFGAGIPVVSTSIGSEGLGVQHGRDLLIADTPEAFAAACAELVDSSELREQLAAGGAAFLRKINAETAAAFRAVVDDCLARAG